MSNFAPPVGKLGESGLGVAAAPSGGMGLALTPDGKIPGGVLFSGASAYKMSCGTATVTFAASATSDSPVITHGLGVTPIVVLVTADTGIATAFVQVTAKTNTTITIQAHDVDNTARTGTNNIYWLVIG